MYRLTLFLVALLAAAGPAQSQSDRIVVPLQDPTRPAELEVSLLSGGITVTGWDGKEVAILPNPGQEAMRGEPAEPEAGEDTDERARGLHRIPNLSSGLDIGEHDNVVTISSHNHREVDLAIQVPRNTSLTLTTVNDGDIVVHDVNGEVTVENLNGDVQLAGISGAVVVQTTNGDIEAAMLRLDPNKACSFASMNGDIDVTLPAATKAELRLKSDNGEIYTDFDLKLSARTETEDPAGQSKGRRGSPGYGYETVMAGTLNGGGPMIRFQTFNGSIYIRKGK